MSVPSTEPQHQTAKRLYDARAPTYENSWHPSFASRFLALASPQPGEHVLDLACGTGLVTLAAATAVGPTGSVTGIDASSGMLSVAREKQASAAPGASGRVQLLEHDVADLAALPDLQRRRFDALTVASALVLLPRPRDALRSWLPYLKPGARVVLDVPHPRNQLAGVLLERVAAALSLPLPYHRSWVSGAASLARLVEGAGLELQELAAVRRQAGYGRRAHGVQDADAQFDAVVQAEAWRVLREAGDAVLSEARARFQDLWRQAADPDGVVEELDTVFVAVARKPLSAAERADAVGGGCACGAVRFVYTQKLQSPVKVSKCHCVTCRRLTGGAGYMACVGVKAQDVVWIPKADRDGDADAGTTGSGGGGGGENENALRIVRFSDKADRAFCGRCGAPVYMKYHRREGQKVEDEIIDLVLTAIDEEGLKGKEMVESHIWLKEKAEWEVVPEDGSEKWAGFKSEGVKWKG